MNVLREVGDTRQIPGEPRRRWFSSPSLDLIVWLSEDEAPIGFQFCYDKEARERALTWRAGRGYQHSAVDSGELPTGRYKGTPILVADGVFDTTRVTSIFAGASVDVPERIREFVARHLENYPEG